LNCIHRIALTACTVLTLLAHPHARAEEVFNPEIFPASNDAELAIRNFQLPAGMKAEVFAAEPQLANPVGLSVDLLGRVYILETFRAGLSDIDGATGATLDNDMPLRTVDEREAFLRKRWGADVTKFAREAERLRLLEDTDGDGRADRDSVFMESRGLTDGIGAGVLAHRGQVYWANVPRLWKLRDSNGDGKADERESLHYGYGVHGGIRGHDLHGLRVGPDGKLYMSMGDRGVNITSGNRTIELLDTGGVLRCNPDGSDLEIFAIGLRNSHDLVFDELGNLFTCDNDSGVGDKCRVQYLVEGSDNGWRSAFQFIHAPNPRGVWNTEKLWQTQFKGQAAFVIPAIAHLTNGPAGITYYPGTGLSDHFARRFFLADFRYSAPGSGLHTFRMNPKGAGFAFADVEKSIWGVLLTDADFGPDSQLYCSDWVSGGAMPKKGRVYRILDSERAKSAVVLETKKILNEGMEKRATVELLQLLGHTNMLVRREAQFELAARGKSCIDGLVTRTAAESPLLARVHAIWALGQIGRSEASALKSLLPLLTDADAEVRAQTAKALGDNRYKDAGKHLVPLLKDDSARVRFFAAQSLAKTGDTDALQPLLELLRTNADEDVFVRHSTVLALAGTQSAKSLMEHAADPSPSVRMGVLLALRRLNDAGIARFLKDTDPLLILEAARAIHDVPIPAAFSDLAKMISSVPAGSPSGLTQRILNAHFRLGAAENAQALAAFVLRTDVALELRVEALKSLTDWAAPHGRDRVLNTWRPLPPRDPTPATQGVKPFLLALLNAGDAPDLQVAACRFAAQHGIAESAPALHALACDEQKPSTIRVTAFAALVDLRYEKLAEVVRIAVASKDPPLRKAALPQLALLNPVDAVPLLSERLGTAPFPERQMAIELLAKMNRPDADATLTSWLDKLLAGEAPAQIQLDLLDVAKSSPNAELKKRYEKYQASLPADNEAAPFQIALTGGDGVLGKKVFFENEKVQCSRCHKIGGKGGEVGPDLSKVAATRDRAYLLESIILPNTQITQGYEGSIVLLKTGAPVIGMVKGEDEKTLSVLGADGKTVTIQKEDIKTRRRQPVSAMPPMGEVLTAREIRDVVEYLSTLKK